MTRRSLEDDSDTESLTPSVTEYPTFWGRRYHNYKANSYLFPNDEEEQERLDTQYSLIKDLVHDGESYFAPVRHVGNVLDIGTGTGIWAIDVAKAKPAARVVGQDLSPIQPARYPRNVRFEIFDCNQADWGRYRASYDLIHTRMMFGALASFPQMIRTAKEYLRPGIGWLECQELLPTPFTDDNSMPADWKYREWVEHYRRAETLLDPPRRAFIADKIKFWMLQAGYVDVREQIHKIPLNHWFRKDKKMKILGLQWGDNLAQALQGLSYKPFQEGLGWSREEIEVFLAAVRASLSDTTVHAYQKMYVVYGRRPGLEDEKRARPRHAGVK